MTGPYSRPSTRPSPSAAAALAADPLPDYDGEYAFYRAHAADRVPLAQPVRVAGLISGALYGVSRVPGERHVRRQQLRHHPAR
jgi:hypothetical protein